ncbi:MAG TPA: hypothetical protein VKM54_09690 [Myxococcota bacterium]|nr:hypothetical protein [Myxococcota bacterium]
MLPPWRRTTDPDPDAPRLYPWSRFSQPSPAPTRRARAQRIPADGVPITVRMVDAMVAKALGRPPTELETPFYENATFARFALALLAGQNLDRGVSLDHAVDAALAATTSDFPLALGNIFDNLLLAFYGVAQPTYRKIAAMVPFQDFRQTHAVRVAEFPALLQTGESAEVKFGVMSENQELLSLVTYGRICSFSRVLLINDDLGAFRRLAESAASRILEFEGATFFPACFGSNGLGATLASDGVAVFNSAHANIGATGALSLTTLGSASGLLQAQTTADGSKLNLEVATLLVSPASRRLAESVIPLPSVGKIAVVSDANLSGTRFYVAADPGACPCFVYGGLRGAPSPIVTSRRDFLTDGVSFKVLLDFGCGAIDYRGGVTGAGA